MVGTLYDYMIALTVVGVTFIASVMIIPNMSYVNLLYVNQQQLRNVAQETLKAILLETGYPIDWGSIDPFDQKYLKRFGLAYSNSPTFYVLDPDKVQRLVVENPLGYIEYEKMRDLMRLKGYGFKLSIIPPFDVTISNRLFQPPDISLGIKVSHHNGRPLANAVVQTTFIYAIYQESSGNVTVRSTAAETAYTDSLGTCEIDETLANPPAGWEIKDVIAILSVTVADVATVVAVYQSINNPAEVIDIWTVGDNITLTIPVNELYPFDQPQEADWVWDIVAYYGEGDLSELYRGGTGTTDKLNWGQGSPYKVWSRTIRGLKSSDPALMILTLSCVPKHEGRRPLLIAGPYPNWLGSRVIQYGGANPQGDSVVKLQRDVVVSGMTYLLEFTLWKEIA